MKIDKMVLDRIPTTRDRAIHLQAIQSELAISENQLKAIIKLLRLQGIPVCNDYQGYWIAENEHDMKWYIAQMEQLGYTSATIYRGLPKTETKPHTKQGQGYHTKKNTSKGA
jgi:biotin operon repressor